MAGTSKMYNAKVPRVLCSKHHENYPRHRNDREANWDHLKCRECMAKATGIKFNILYTRPSTLSQSPPVSPRSFQEQTQETADVMKTSEETLVSIDEAFEDFFANELGGWTSELENLATQGDQDEQRSERSPSMSNSLSSLFDPSLLSQDRSPVTPAKKLDSKHQKLTQKAFTNGSSSSALASKTLPVVGGSNMYYTYTTQYDPSPVFIGFNRGYDDLYTEKELYTENLTVSPSEVYTESKPFSYEEFLYGPNNPIPHPVQVDPFVDQSRSCQKFPRPLEPSTGYVHSDLYALDPWELPTGKSNEPLHRAYAQVHPNAPMELNNWKENEENRIDKENADLVKRATDLRDAAYNSQTINLRKVAVKNNASMALGTYPGPVSWTPQEPKQYTSYSFEKKPTPRSSNAPSAVPQAIPHSTGQSQRLDDIIAKEVKKQVAQRMANLAVSSPTSQKRKASDEPAPPSPKKLRTSTFTVEIPAWSTPPQKRQTSSSPPPAPRKSKTKAADRWIPASGFTKPTLEEIASIRLQPLARKRKARPVVVTDDSDSEDELAQRPTKRVKKVYSSGRT
jgi:hypothetical protein